MKKSLTENYFLDLINQNRISFKFDLKKYIQPASIDIPIGDVAYLIKEKFLPFNKKVSEILNGNYVDKINLKNGANLLKGQTYLIPSIYLNFEDTNYFATISPKSSIGRIDLMVRSIFDNYGLYDTIKKNSKGQLWIEVTPQSFNVKVKEGLSLSQIKIFDLMDDSNVDFNSEKLLFDENKKSINNNLYQNSLILSIAIPNNKIMGFEALGTNEVIDLSKIRYLDSSKYFRKIYLDSNKLTLEKDKFYIFYTKENIRIPNNLSAEMLPFSHLIGELRVHYAGFFDPGFGGKFGTSAVLEVRSHESITIYDGQPICLMNFFENKQIPNKLYGELNNSYQNQKGPKLAKYFK